MHAHLKSPNFSAFPVNVAHEYCTFETLLKIATSKGARKEKRFIEGEISLTDLLYQEFYSSSATVKG